MAAALGLVIGSFLNAVIARLPARRSLRGRSACPRCGTTIRAVDNVPLLSFAVLRGRCRQCRGPISWRYPAIEGLTALAFAGAYLRFGLSTAGALACLLLAALIAITAIDMEHQIIPDLITLPGIVVGFVGSVTGGLAAPLEALLGIAVGGGLFLVIIVASAGGMGAGDMKLGAMLGAFLGWKAVLFAILVSVILGGLVASALLLAGRKGRKDPIPFGPFLAVGGVTALFVAPPVFLFGL